MNVVKKKILKKVITFISIELKCLSHTQKKLQMKSILPKTKENGTVIKMNIIVKLDKNK